MRGNPEDHLMGAVVNLSRMWNRIVGKKMADIEFNSIQSRIMGYLFFQNCHGRPVCQRDIEEEFHIRKSSVSSVIHTLEKKGLIERKAVAKDARQKQVVLSEKGIEVQHTVIERLDALEDWVKEILTEEERKLWFSCVCKIEARLKEAEDA